jgi:hypothetical protein
LIVFSRYLARLGALIADTSTSGIRVARELDRLLGERGKPKTIVSDNGTELTSNAILQGPTITRSPDTTSRRASQSGMPLSNRSLDGGGCVVRRRFFACSALRLPSVVKAGQERG